ncbi:MAG: copper-binding protein [Alphaproteobacteria bacterium]|nr:copper-binding protein [Alphaproteobacteria bacterium]
MNPLFFSLAIIFGAAVSVLPVPAMAGPAHTYEFGAPGNPAETTRSIEVNLYDNYYEPDAISVKPGETIRFVLKNNGELLHEFSIDTLAEHAEHRREMAEMMEMGMITPTGIDPEKMKMDHSKMKMGDATAGKGMPMRHDDPNNVMLAPDERKELIWTFTKAMEIEFACSVPGHYESGMMGRIDFGK